MKRIFLLVFCALPALSQQAVLVSHAIGTTSASMGFTGGASVLIAVVSATAASNACSATLSDTVGGLATSNVWGHGTEYHNAASNVSVCLWYSYGKAAGAALGTGATHVVTVSGFSASISALAFAGTLTGANSPFDIGAGASVDSASSVSTGAITPSLSCSLVVSGASMRSSTIYSSSPLTATDTLDWVTGTRLGVGASFVVQSGTAAPVSNMWSMSGPGQIAATIASFKVADTNCATWSTFRVASGTFTQGDTTVTVADAHGAFTPKAIMVVGTAVTTPGTPIAGAGGSVGYCTASNAVSSSWSMGDSGGATANSYARRMTLTNVCVIAIPTVGTSAVKARADVVMLSTGFALNWITNDAAGRKWSWVAWGGSGVSAAAGSITAPSSSGTATTTVGFQPSAIFTAGGQGADSIGNIVTPATNANPMFGFATPTAGGAATGQSVDNLATSSITGVETENVVDIVSSASGDAVALATWTAADSTSFTLTFTTTTTIKFVYLAITGGAWYVGRSNQPTSTGNQIHQPPGVHPLGAILISANKATSSSKSTHARFSIGLTDGANMESSFFGGKGSATVQVATSALRTNALFDLMTEGGASPSTQATVDSFVFEDNRLTLHWSAVDATARDYLWMVFGTPAAITRVPRRVIQ